MRTSLALRKSLVVAAAATLLSAAPAQAQEAPPDNLSGQYVSDVLADVLGGVRRGPALFGKADLTVEIEGDLIGLPDASAFIDLQFVHGAPFSDRFVGDTQVLSNIDAPSAIRPFEAWLHVPFAISGAQAAATVGLIDLNGIFDVQEIGALFIVSSHGIGPDFFPVGAERPVDLSDDLIGDRDDIRCQALVAAIGRV